MVETGKSDIQPSYPHGHAEALKALAFFKEGLNAASAAKGILIGAVGSRASKGASSVFPELPLGRVGIQATAEISRTHPWLIYYVRVKLAEQGLTTSGEYEVKW